MIPLLLAFLVGLSVDRFCKAWARILLTKTVEDLAVRQLSYTLDPVAFAKYLKREDVRREIEQLIEDSKPAE